nr:bifunctional demethylmenaquinone methyltransferase/2-methoxy-6-polyprenyl-1,4-benzoquinol methylase UbiE [Bacteroidota bacterium]
MEMFDSIAGKYEFLNHFLSFGIDKGWRKKAIRIIKNYEHKHILDIATGTGDMTILAAGLEPDGIYGIDISGEMLKIQQKKLIKLKLDHLIKLQQAECENLPFDSNTFDITTTAFGVRNFENLDQGLSEIYRVLNVGGVCIILEFSKPSKFPVKHFYNLYLNHFVPVVGKAISKNKFAYKYLPNTVNQFPHGDDFLKILMKAGFKNSYYRALSGGIASIYVGEK